MDEDAQEWNQIITNWPESSKDLYKRMITMEGLQNIIIPVQSKNNATLAAPLRTVVWKLLLFHQSSALHSVTPDDISTEEKQSKYYEVRTSHCVALA